MKVDHGRILVADGDQDERELIILALRFAGFDVMGAKDSEQACNYFKVNHPDIGLVEVNLPGIDRLAECMENRDEGATFIMFLSAEGEVDMKQFSWSGKAEIITKPISPDRLTRQVERHLHKARAASKSVIP